MGLCLNVEKFEVFILSTLVPVAQKLEPGNSLVTVFEP